MAKAPVGDDVYGEDPSVNLLEQETAEMFGKEAGLFVSSGTQGNLVALLTHCQRGDEAIIGDKAHTYVYEAGGMAVLGGINPRPLKVNADGTIDLDLIRKSIRPLNDHFPRTRLVSIENTQGTVGGVAVDVEYSKAVSEICRENGLKFHIDGARIFNAATALNVSVKTLTQMADSVSICLSKGLCAPVGSVLVGERDFIKEARRNRKLLGGGMRQAGILAEAGRIALNTMSKRLDEDHQNASLLAEKLQECPHIKVISNHTNFVFFEIDEDAPIRPDEFIRRLQTEHGIIMRAYPGFTHTFRCVLHYWIGREQIDTVIEKVKEVLS